MLGFWLTLAFIGFLAMVGYVMVVAFQERKVAQSSDHIDRQTQIASDKRTLLAIFGSIIGGMLLTLIVAWLVFF